MTPPKPGELVEVPLSKLEQAINLRPTTDDPALAELAESIKAHGILEPVLVAGGHDGTFSLLAGYRRCRAAKKAGLLVVPAIVQMDGKTGYSLNQVRELQLVENLQREDLNPIDEAKALKQLLETDDLTQAELAKRIGKSQPYIANRIRLLGLPEAGQQLVQEGKVSPHVVAEILKLPEKATTERNHLVRKIGDLLQKDGEVSPQQFRWDVQSAQRTFTERIQRERAIAAAKFPTCPAKDGDTVCARKGRPEISWPPSKWFTASCGHRWSPSTGKVAPKEAASSGGGYQPPPPPTLPEVDGDVPTSATPEQLLTRILDARKGVKDFSIRWASGTTATLALTAEFPAAKVGKVPGFEADAGHKFVSIETASWQPDDAHRKRAAQDRANLEAWLATF